MEHSATPRILGAISRPLAILYALALVVALIAIRVEWLNAAAGFPLPRGPLDDGKWRVMARADVGWRAAYGPRDASGVPLDRPLTADERGRRDAYVARAKANARLRDWVGTAGVLQYALLPLLGLATLLSIAAEPTRRRFVRLLPVLAILTLASASLLYRAYFPSLGW
jgi:hypothetical protein